MRFLCWCLLWMTFLPIGWAQDANGKISIGYVHIQTSREADASKGLVGGDMAPDLVVRLYGSQKEGFAFSDRFGSVVVPLRPGEYCAQLFRKNGAPIKLSQKCCFSIGAEQYLEVGVEAAFDPSITVLPPPPKRP